MSFFSSRLSNLTICDNEVACIESDEKESTDLGGSETDFLFFVVGSNGSFFKKITPFTKYH